MIRIFKKYIFVCLIVVLFMGSNVFAEDSYFLIERDVVVENGCDVVDTDGATHVFPNESSPSEFLGICALMASGQDVDFIDFGWGLFLDGINGVSTGPSWDPSWAIFYNGESSDVGLTDIALEDGGTISLIYKPYEGTEEYDKVILHISLNNGHGSVDSTEYSGPFVRDEFSIKNAVEFLSLNQEENGSFGDSLYTDWVAIGVSKTKEDKTEDIIASLSNHFKNEKFEGENITDYERHAMALMALGINPYDGTDINYIEKIVNSFDGDQIGEKTLISDDIFSLIVLQKVGYEKNDEMIGKVISNILKNQLPDGSWGGVDMTSAGIMALHKFKDTSDVNESVIKGYKFLKEVERNKGNFGNASSSSWAMQAFSKEGWYEDETKRILKFLTREQDNEEGWIKGEGKNNRIWATAYSIPAVLNLSWTEIMESFPKQEVVVTPKLMESPLKRLKNQIKKILVPELEEIINDNLSQDTNNISQDSGNLTAKNLLKDKVIIMTIILTLVTFVGGWFVIRR